MSQCQLCSQNLTVELESDNSSSAPGSASSQTETFPDDLLLQCGCHFHYHCLLDESPRLVSSFTCPSCGDSIATGPSEGSLQPRILTRYLNEGGLQPSLDILPLVKEEAYLEENPSARPARAFTTLCAEGDVLGMIELLNAISEDPDEGDMEPSEILRWKDPLEDGRPALHVAIAAGQVEAVLLLLWLASGLAEDVFPPEFLGIAQEMGINRPPNYSVPDVRALRSDDGRNAEDVAQERRDVWEAFLQRGLLHVA